MKRAAAFLSYYVGLALGLGTMFNVARDADVWQFLFLPLFGLPIWWIAAGIGIRLGVYPSEFFRTLATAAGLLEPQSKTDGVAAKDSPMGIAVAGITVHLALFIGLTGICAFDDGQLSEDWTDCVVPLGLLLAPLGLAAAALARRSPRLLAVAAVLAAVLGLLSLTGPGLFVLVPAILYGVDAARGLTSEAPDAA